MKTTLFNLHEIEVKEGTVTIEFYAGDIFDIYSDILLLSAYKGKFYPVHGTTWGSLNERTGITVCASQSDECRISDSFLSFETPKNDHFTELNAFELSDLDKPNGFTKATMKTRYKELGKFLETETSEEAETISLPLLGTGNQGISLEESVSELLKTFGLLKRTRLKIIRVFARDFVSIGVLNQKINELLSRKEVVRSSLLEAAMDAARRMLRGQISPLTYDTLSGLFSLTEYNQLSMEILGIKGRTLAEKVCEELLQFYGIELEPSTLHLKINGLRDRLRADRPVVESHLRLLQTYGNQKAHGLGADLNDQDAASIILSMVSVLDFYEFKLAGTAKEMN